MDLLPLRPGIKNPLFWREEPLVRAKWDKIRKPILERDNYTCRYCGHFAQIHQIVHHLKADNDHSSKNLVTCCVACHAVQHIGRNLGLGCIEIWESPHSQVEIVRLTREGVKKKKTLSQIKKTLKLKRGQYPATSVQYANSLLKKSKQPNFYLSEPLVAVFVRLKRWQV